MAELHIIETLGSVYKVENLATLSHSILPNTFALETREPFPGYHGSNFILDDITKKSIFFVIPERVSAEVLYRAVARIRKYLSFTFDAAVAELNVYNQQYHAIRIKRFKTLENILTLQQALRDEGFHFSKPRKVNQQGIIKVKKYMLLEEVEQDFYIDHEDPNIAYFRLPMHITWNLFEDITLRMKHNLPVKDFDLALGVIFRRMGIIDVVRIFGDNPSIDLLRMLKEKYEEAIKRVQ